MPEGPEILFFSTFLKNKFLTTKISNIKSNTGEPIELPEDFEGTILDIYSKGKLLYIKVSSTVLNKHYYIHIHLGISGWILFKEPKNFVKYEFKLTTKTGKEFNILIDDKTRLSKMHIYNEIEHNEKLNKLGIDIFTSNFTLDKFESVIKSKNMILASFLLKQELFCGIGNYIKNEVLYLGNLDINIKTNVLNKIQIIELYKNILFVAHSCLIEQLKNSDIEKFLAPEYKINTPNNIEIPYNYRIYGRNTTSDGKSIKKVKVGGRDTYYVEAQNLL
jgi:formamidopyrimidine-DNA glycosylase